MLNIGNHDELEDYIVDKYGYKVEDDVLKRTRGLIFSPDNMDEIYATIEYEASVSLLMYIRSQRAKKYNETGKIGEA